MTINPCKSAYKAHTGLEPVFADFGSTIARDENREGSG